MHGLRMITYSLSDSVFLYHADMRDALRALPDCSIDSICCDPPYHLTSIVKRFGAENAAPALSNGPTGVYARSSSGFMGKQWDGGDITFQVETWREVWRVLKPGGYVAAFGAPKNFGRLQCAILDAGFEERDTILHMVDPSDPIVGFLESLSDAQLDAFLRVLADSELAGFVAWCFGTGFPKSHDVSKKIDAKLGAVRIKLAPHGRAIGTNKTRVEAGYRPNEVQEGFYTTAATPEAATWEGWGTALKPAFEPIVLARKPLSEGTVAANVLRHGIGAINVDGCRIPGAKPDTTRGASLKASSMVGTLGAQGRIVDDGASRWPANVVHDGSAEVVEAFPAETGKSHGGRSPNPNSTSYGFVKGDAKRMIGKGDSGSAARFSILPRPARPIAPARSTRPSSRSRSCNGSHA